MPNRNTDPFTLHSNSVPRGRQRTRRRIRSGKGKYKDNSESSEESNDTDNKNELKMGSITANPVNNPVITINNSSGGDRNTDKDKDKDKDQDEMLEAIIDYIATKYYDNI